ncbi:MAG: Imidazole glycerol phosphate synthase, glutamine amidotransferase subunit [uncultured bacterium]|nr:MAG: Imidazole glycerol phosphate synthase, glutamine amidotransferase subunit [uncultured bacterium]KKU26262.1 MAG: imidazole glycerol phosphate synthase subunit HisH [Microgenomates group bacterium GW2011_GWA2_46_16]
MTAQVVVIDYGMSNLASLARSLEKCGASPLFSSDPKEILEASKIILPGVGSFAEGMANLSKLGLVSPLRDIASGKTIPILGICLGMQLLASTGSEGYEVEGLNLIPGKVIKLESHNDQDKIPHVGWNNIEIKQDDPILAEIPDNTDFYFVHSYYFQPTSEDTIIATTPHCGNFASVIRLNNIYGTQFHPEKSSQPGLKLLSNFLNL